MNQFPISKPISNANETKVIRLNNKVLRYILRFLCILLISSAALGSDALVSLSWFTRLGLS